MCIHIYILTTLATFLFWMLTRKFCGEKKQNVLTPRRIYPKLLAKACGWKMLSIIMGIFFLINHQKWGCNDFTIRGLYIYIILDQNHYILLCLYIQLYIHSHSQSIQTYINQQSTWSNGDNMVRMISITWHKFG